VSYDANGNIRQYDRRSNTGAMDSLVYRYQYQTSTNTLDTFSIERSATTPFNPYAVNATEVRNQLGFVDDRQTNAALQTTDIDDQAINNYDYDEIGNLIKDVRETISFIGWNVYGKIDSIEKTTTTAGAVKRITYKYDPSGNRISKRIVKVGSAIVTYTTYVRDASGNVMAVYDYSRDTTSLALAAQLSNGVLNLSEQHIYGSSRIGVLNRAENMELNQNKLLTFTVGNKFFELGNHLGNVLATISDRKIQNGTVGSTVTFYTADVRTANDYYPFGMAMPGRTFVAATVPNSYRYGFNGKENSPEITNGAVSFEARIYDARIGRFLSLDPLQTKYPSDAPYIFAGNTPIGAIDVDGKYKIVVHLQYNAETKKYTLLRVERQEGLKAVPVMKQMYCGGCNRYYMGEDSYDWYDYMTFKVEVVNNNSNIPMVIGIKDKIVGRPRTNTDGNRGIDEWWARFKVSDGRGGIMWTSTGNGGWGAGVWTIPENVDIENIDAFTQLQTVVDRVNPIGLPKLVELVDKLVNAHKQLNDEKIPNPGTDENGKPQDHMAALQSFIDGLSKSNTSTNTETPQKLDGGGSVKPKSSWAHLPKGSKFYDKANPFFGTRTVLNDSTAQITPKGTKAKDTVDSNKPKN
jgi:RHS repeat-associated protein